MKIMHQVNNLAIGGVETYVQRLCKYSNEDEVIVYSHQDGPVRAWLESIGVAVYFADIDEVIRDREIDVLVMHTGSYLPDYARGLKEKFPNLKFITVLHTYYTVPEHERWVDAIVGVSKSIGLVNDNSYVIQPGVECNERFVIGEVTRLAPYKFIEDLIIIAAKLKEKENEIPY